MDRNKEIDAILVQLDKVLCALFIDCVNTKWVDKRHSPVIVKPAMADLRSLHAAAHTFRFRLDHIDRSEKS
jgi:hypothetical protein